MFAAFLSNADRIRKDRQRKHLRKVAHRIELPLLRQLTDNAARFSFP